MVLVQGMVFMKLIAALGPLVVKHDTGSLGRFMVSHSDKEVTSFISFTSQTMEHFVGNVLETCH